MLRHACLPALSVLLICCGEAPAPKSTAAPPAIQVEAPGDETRRFPMDGRGDVERVADRLLGREYLPGGNVAVYQKRGKSWKQFVIKLNDGAQTALLLARIKDHLKEPKFVAHMGGYFGADVDGQPVFVFPKGRWIGGIVGLDEKAADVAARQMAPRLD